MDDKDRAGEARGAEDALRPTLPGGERAREGESGSEPEQASGTIDRPIQPGEVQPGETMEQAQLRGGPVDIAPERPRR
ncbi:hypothetical protein [Falsiroseomonas sp. E2-1-a20]|uniref:hypothetical protein n=1 Tax=Falsiroseomonas sp. E2-1-a20 TaxID=3239300 RepID=UPI003F35F0EF